MFDTHPIQCTVKFARPEAGQGIGRMIFRYPRVGRLVASVAFIDERHGYIDTKRMTARQARLLWKKAVTPYRRKWGNVFFSRVKLGIPLADRVSDIEAIDEFLVQEGVYKRMPDDRLEDLRFNGSSTLNFFSGYANLAKQALDRGVEQGVVSSEDAYMFMNRVHLAIR